MVKKWHCTLEKELGEWANCISKMSQNNRTPYPLHKKENYENNFIAKNGLIVLPKCLKIIVVVIVLVTVDIVKKVRIMEIIKNRKI